MLKSSAKEGWLCRTCHNRTHRKYLGSRINKLLLSARKRAQLKGMEFGIDAAWLRPRLEAGVCEVSGLPFDFTIGKGNNRGRHYSPSLDRIDSTKGYTPDNVQVVVFILNAARNAWGDEPLRKLVSALVHKWNL